MNHDPTENPTDEAALARMTSLMHTHPDKERIFCEHEHEGLDARIEEEESK